MFFQYGGRLYFSEPEVNTITNYKYKKKTVEVLLPLRPIVHNTSKTAKITWYILVLYWAVGVIEVIYYIHDPVEY